jgi:hypothetical protein
MSSIFVCYRRADAAGYAGRLFDSLSRAFGDGSVFRDVDSIETASRFPDAIRREIEGCRVFVPVIGPAWLRALNQSAADGPEGQDDWVQLEIAAAIERKICIIPVTVGGAVMPSLRDLPVALRPLAERQCRDLRDGDTWESDVALLEKRISRELGTLPRVGRAARRRALVAASVVLTMAFAVTAYAAWFAGPTFDMAAEPVVVFESGNKEDVTQRPQGPPAAAAFTTTGPYFLTHVYTYHWNGGNGSAPGRVRLRRADGEEFGPWEVGATSGHNSAQNVNWVAQPRITLPAGSYTVVDSEPSTWSFNATSKNRGFAIIKGLPPLAANR